MTAPPVHVTVLNVSIAVLQGGEEKPVQIAGAFDRITTAEACSAAGRAIGDMIAENLSRRLQIGQVLA